MKIIFMGTPDFAAAALESLAQKHEVLLAVTQPDKPKGRGRELSVSEVKRCAGIYGIPVFQPERIRDAEAVEELRRYDAEMIVVAAFGQILPKEILTMPKYGCINIHASLLPKYRGAAPIQQAIIDGEEKTGVTIMQMDEGLDTGAILMQKEIEIKPDETGGSLFDKLSYLGAGLVLDAIDKIGRGTMIPIKQDETKSSYVKMLKKEQGRIDFTRPAAELERLIRALNPWPSAYTTLEGKTLKIWEASILDQAGGVPGMIVAVTKDALLVSCGDGMLAVRTLQLEGKKRMSVRDFLLGKRIEPGTMLG